MKGLGRTHCKMQHNISGCHNAIQHELHEETERRSAGLARRGRAAQEELRERHR